MNYSELSIYAQNQSWAAQRKREVDAENERILAERQDHLNQRRRIGVGDFVLDGDKVLRVAYDWGDAIQLTDGRFGQSFYLDGRGRVSFSGGLDSGIDAARFVATDERRAGSVWFFSQNQAQAHNGYYTQAFFRVWRLEGVSE